MKGYTEKQWGRDCKELPAFIIKRLPVRLTFDNNYFNALYQGIPIGGYTKMVENLLDGIEVRLNTDYLEHKAELDALADKVVYTGPIDAYFGFKLGTLEYRSVRFENEVRSAPSQSQRPGGPNREKARSVEGGAMEQQELYRYYSTQRPVDIGTYPKDPDNPLTGFLNYDERTSVEHGAFRAWGRSFTVPLTRINISV